MGTGGAYKFPEEARLGEDVSFAGSCTCIRMSRVRRNSKRGLVVQSQKVISRNFHESRSAELTRALGVGYGWVKKIPATVVPEGSIEIVCDILGIEGLYLAADSAVNAVAAYEPARNHVVARLS